MINYRYGKRMHRGCLQDSLDTTVYISEDEFRSELDEDKDLKFYSVDNRCNQILFLNYNRQDYQWYFIEVIENGKA